MFEFDKQTKTTFIAGLLTVFIAAILGGFIPAIYSFSLIGANISVGYLISGGVGAIAAVYILKALKM
jgi:hypothetical protein